MHPYSFSIYIYINIYLYIYICIELVFEQPSLMLISQVG